MPSLKPNRTFTNLYQLGSATNPFKHVSIP
jgi:hypothetical protein